MTLRVGIISAAWGGFAHLPAWRALRGVEVTAICTSRQETALAAAQRLNIARPFWDAEAMCADADLDIIDIGTRPVLRQPWILTALAAGKHVYNACPHAADWAGAKKIDTAWRQSGTIGVVDSYARWLPAHRQMKAMIDDGFIGQPLGGRCRFNISLFNQPSRQFPYNWFGEAGQGVSAIRNNGSHMLFTLIDMLGPFTEVVSDDRRVLDEWRFADDDVQHPQTNDLANVMLRFASGLVLPMQISWSMPLHNGWCIDLFGDGGRLRAASPTFPTMRDLVLTGGKTGKAMAPVAIPDKLRCVPGGGLNWDSDPQPSVAMALSMQAMVDAIRGEGLASPDFAMALEVERLQEAIRLSTVERRWVTVPEII